MSTQTDRLENQLTELQRILTEMGPDFSGLMLGARELCNRLEKEHFRLAVLGQFKRGKSSLLNALMGERLLPTGVLPLTTIPTILRYGPEPRVHVIWMNGRSETHSGASEVLTKALMRCVTERENPNNRLGVMQVEVEHPGTLLANGLEMIDTPGVGSTILRNTRTAREVLTVCDGALFVLSPDSPITETEVQFLRAVKNAATRLTVVVSKADTLAATDRVEMLAFLRDVLAREVGFSNHEPLFLISAHQALEARITGDTSLWSQSGMGELEAHLTHFAQNDKRAALREAIRRKAARLIQETLFSLEIQRKAIDLPRQELERRAERLEAQLAKIDLERVYFEDRLAGDRRRIWEEVDRKAEALADQARQALTARVEKSRLEPAHGTVKAALAEEVECVFGRAGKDLFDEGSARFQFIQDLHGREMEFLIDRIRRTAADLFEVASVEVAGVELLDAIKEPRLIRQLWVTSFTEEAASWITRLLPASLQIKRLERRLHEEIEYLVKRNVEELRWTIHRNLDEALRTFQSRMEAQLDVAIEAIRTSIRTARRRQAERESIGVSELERLEDFRDGLARLLAVFSADGSVSDASPI